MFRRLRLWALALAAGAIPACGGNDGDSSTTQVGATFETAPDFHLVDKNPHSKTHGRSISPRDYLGLVPGFYFTHAN